MRKCKYCGSTNITIIMWDGARCGGSKVKCMDCNKILEETTYREGDGKHHPLFSAYIEENENGN